MRKIGENGSEAVHRSAEDALAAFIALQAAGEAPAFEDWVARFPVHADEMRRLHRFNSRLDADLDFLAQRSTRIGSLFYKQLHRERAVSAARPEFEALVVGGRIGDFELVRKIDEGGMGQVWEARQVSLRRTVALKFIRPDRVSELAIAFFGREARAGGRLNHPNIVTVYGNGQTGGLHWIAQEFVGGGTTLYDFIEANRGTPSTPPGYFKRVARFFLQLSDAIHAAHEAGVIHRDLKPQNILVTPDDQPKVTDFGLARLEDERPISEPLGIEGTPLYMSPEQATASAGAVDHRTDIFSLGAILYEVLTKKRPFQGASHAETYESILHQDPVDPRKLQRRLPEELAVICMKALEKRRQDRYQSMSALGEDLRRFLDNESILAQRPSTWRRARKWTRRHPTLATAATLGILLLVGGEYALRGLKGSAQAALKQRKENLVIQADYAIDDARLGEVRDYMDEYAALDANDPLPNLVLARGYSQYLRFAEAEAEFNAALDKGHVPIAPNPQDAREQYLHGLALLIRRDPALREETIEAFESAISLDPLIRASYLPLYQLHKDAHDLEAAERSLSDFQGILATGDDYFTVVEALRDELRGRHEDGLERLLDLKSELGEERSRELRLARLIGRLHLKWAFEIGRTDLAELALHLDAAETSFETAVEETPTDATSWANLGMVSIGRDTYQRGTPDAEGELERALEHGRRAIQEYPKHPSGHRVVLNALVLGTERTFQPLSPDRAALQEALEVANDLRALDPSHPSLDLMEARARFLLGVAAEANGDLDHAHGHFAASLELDPNQLLPRLRLAQDAYLREDFEAAREQLILARDGIRRFGAEARVKADLQAAVHIWTLGVAGHMQSAEGDELGLDARADVEAALAAGVEIQPVELLNYVEFLATSPSPALRDCSEARRVFESYRLQALFGGTPAESAARDLGDAIESCD